MIVEWEAPAGLAVAPQLFALVPDAGAGRVLQIGVGALAVAVILVQLTGRLRASGRALSLALPSLVFAGTFVHGYGLIDEVSVNLEHAWNLFHHGRFSFSPETMVDGTVELPYYLAHAPFAASRQTLVLGNFLVSLLVGWLHLWLLWRLRLARDPAVELAMLTGFALWSPVVVVLASGFGNGLLSLLFLASVALGLRGRPVPSLVLSGLLPLVRPDGVLLALVNLAAVAVLHRRDATAARRRPLRGAGLVLLPFASLLALLGVFRVVYGHWMPTPVLFKSVKPSMLAMANAEEVRIWVDYWTEDPLHLVALGVAAAACAAVVLRRASRGSGDPVPRLLLYAVLASPSVPAFVLAGAVLHDNGFYTTARYWLGFEVLLAALLLAASARAAETLLAGGPRVALGGAGIAIALPGLLLAQSIVAPSIWYGFEWRNREDAALAGAFTERHVPGTFTLATSELATFALMVERPVMDLWGYTNRAIATSGACNALPVRYAPGHFLERRPDIYWPFWFTRSPEAFNYDTAEASLFEAHHTSPRYDMLGDLTRVLALYDLLIVRLREGQIAYLVRTARRADLEAHLLRQGFVRTRAREPGVGAWRERYVRERERQPRFACP